ncbi:MAG: helix-turn-helix transcriptional regulator [Gammaproteobacteria bacterium]|nr:helix-turn-helix transcriptional regulator [Gammaproteobacteria bacterium]
MAKSFNILKNKMSKSAQKEANLLTEKMISDMPLQELRQAKNMSQERLAEILDTKQSNISRIEKRTDMYISTLRSYIQAMGGELQITAHFPEGNININQFQEI